MEENRLKPMVAGYDEEMFNRLYKKTEGLRMKLASEINPHRFGLQYGDILSFFDIKFIYAFNKYCQKHNEQVLLGHLINALSFFKCRILRAAYTQAYSQTIISDDSLYHDDELVENHPISEDRDMYYKMLMSFMKTHLSTNAYAILDLQLNPPPFILYKINIDPNSNLPKIPDHLLVEYFDLGSSPKAHKFISDLKKEINLAISYAKEHFKTKPSEYIHA